MTDRIEKALQKLSQKERARVKDILLQLKNRDITGLDIKKLRGRGDIFRVRKGDIRILYRLDEAGQIFVAKIERRGEGTYK